MRVEEPRSSSPGMHRFPRWHGLQVWLNLVLLMMFLRICLSLPFGSAILCFSIICRLQVETELLPAAPDISAMLPVVLELRRKKEEFQKSIPVALHHACPSLSQPL